MKLMGGSVLGFPNVRAAAGVRDSNLLADHTCMRS